MGKYHASGVERKGVIDCGDVKAILSKRVAEGGNSQSAMGMWRTVCDNVQRVTLVSRSMIA